MNYRTEIPLEKETNLNIIEVSSGSVWSYSTASYIVEALNTLVKSIVGFVRRNILIVIEPLLGQSN